MAENINVIGQMDNTQDHTFDCDNRVYGRDGIAPSILTSCGGGTLTKGFRYCGYARKRRDERATT